MARRTLRPWTQGEDALICKLHRQGDTAAEVATALPERTPIAVVRRIQHLIRGGFLEQRRTPWTEAEDILIYELRDQDVAIAAIAERLGRSAEAVSGHIRELIRQGRLSRKGGEEFRHRRRWSAQEEAVLTRMRELGATADQIAAKLPNRTRGAIEARIHELLEDGEIERKPQAPQSHRPWSPEEDQLVAVMREAGTSVPEIATILDRSVASVHSRIAQRVRKGELALLSASQTAAPSEDER